MISRIALSPIGIIGFGMIWVYGANRVPFPPARTTAFTNEPPYMNEEVRCARQSMHLESMLSSPIFTTLAFFVDFLIRWFTDARISGITTNLAVVPEQS